jgi:hypothetical protein
LFCLLFVCLFCLFVCLFVCFSRLSPPPPDLLDRIGRGVEQTMRVAESRLRHVDGIVTARLGDAKRVAGAKLSDAKRAAEARIGDAKRVAGDAKRVAGAKLSDAKRAAEARIGDAKRVAEAQRAAVRRFRARVEAKLDEKPVIKAVDKATFTLTVLLLVAVEAVMLRAPWRLGDMYAATMLPLLAVRYHVYHGKRWHFFLLDFCYYVQALLLFHLYVYPSSRALSVALFLFANGPLLAAVVAWHNSLVFHDVDKVTSLMVHVFPALVTFTRRWLPGSEGGAAGVTGLGSLGGSGSGSGSGSGIGSGSGSGIGIGIGTGIGSGIGSGIGTGIGIGIGSGIGTGIGIGIGSGSGIGIDIGSAELPGAPDQAATARDVLLCLALYVAWQVA